MDVNHTPLPVVTHTSSADVDDRPSTPPTQPKIYKHGIAPGDTVQVLLGRGKHSDKITTSSLTSFSKKQNQGNKIMLN
jgi:hypothetical protein